MEKLPALDGMCPNYALSGDRLEIQPQNLFTAWEIAKAVPMFGFDVYYDFAEANTWVRSFLPQALGVLDAPRPQPNLRNGVWDRVARLPGMGKLETLERIRKHAADERDVGVNMKERSAQRSMDRHTPTRSSYVLHELAYRMSLFGLTDHPLYPDVRDQGQSMTSETDQWGGRTLEHPEHVSIKEG